MVNSNSTHVRVHGRLRLGAVSITEPENEKAKNASEVTAQKLGSQELSSKVKGIFTYMQARATISVIPEASESALQRGK